MITIHTTITEMEELGLKEYIPYLISEKDSTRHSLLAKKNSLKMINDIQPTWDADDMAYGLNRLLSIISQGRKVLYDIYAEEEVKAEPRKEKVKLLYFPSDKPVTKKYVVLCAGGAYGAVCSLAEAIPVAAKLNELGINAFCLNYRVGTPNLFPMPMEDLAAAIKYIAEREEEFQIHAKHYAVGGFSAGGHLAASWGTKHLGYEHYGVPKPEMLFLVYPMINVWKNISHMPEPVKKVMLSGLLGEGYSEETCNVYNIDLYVDKDYPPFYMIQANDDHTVSVSNNKEFDRISMSVGIPHIFELIESGNHGFGLGSKTPGAGYVERAIEFWRRLQ